MFRTTSALLIFVFTSLSFACFGQSTDRLKAHAAHGSMKEASAFKKLRWQFLGPDNISGRVTDVAVPFPKGKNYSIYVATASGGVWKTNNEGTTWKPVFDQEASTSIGDVTIDPSNHDVVWVGTGECNIFRSSMAGTGVYRSADAGKTWQHMGLQKTHTISRIVIHPTNSDIVYVAASGHEWTDNSERGIYRTTDGGKNWKRIHHINDMTGSIDLVMHPTNPDILYTSTWQRRRELWNDPRNSEDTDSSGIFKTIDGGSTWKAINKGLPEAKYRGRIGIDVCRSKPDTLYAFVDCYQIAKGPSPRGEDSYGRKRKGSIKGAEIYRTDDGGANWRKTSPNNRSMRGASSTYGWVFGQVRADPVDPDTVYMMGLGLKVSHDSGKTFESLRGMHGDHHALWIDPENTSYLVNGNDGGVAISYDGGKNWRTSRETLPAVQFYNVAMDMETPFHVYGSIQDHGSQRGTVIVGERRNRISGRDWIRTSGGEGSTHAVAPEGTPTLYSEGFYGSISRTDLETGNRTRIMPKNPKGEPELRGQWVAPFMISHHNPRIIYHGMNHVFRSMDRGEKWERISPDLSYADPKKMGDIPYQTIFTMDESHHRFGVLYAGTDDGRLHRTDNSGDSWQEITKGLASNRWISRVETSRFTDGVVFVAQNGKRNDDFTAYLWRSSDHGKTWKDISSGIPCGPINVIREDPKKKGLLFVGTDVGVFVSQDEGQTWDVLASGLPSTFVHDIAVHPRDDVMVAATHGRGMYGMDVRPLRGGEAEQKPEIDPAVAKARTRREKHERANALQKKWSKIHVGGKAEPHWTSDTEFWYRRRQAADKAEFVRCNATTGETTLAPELETEFKKNRSGKGKRQKSGRRTQRRRDSTLSTDGRWRVTTSDSNLWITNTASKKKRQVTQGGTEEHSWGFLSWSPNSTAILICRVTPGEHGKLITVATAAKHGQPATVKSRDYARPGDKFTSKKLHTLRLLSSGDWSLVEVNSEAIDFGNPRPRWSADSKTFTYEKRDRSRQRQRVIEVNPTSGKTRTIIDEKSDTFIDFYRKGWSRYINDSAEILWTSERDGWNHIYLYNSETGQIKNRVTSGKWVVRGIDHVDLETRTLWFHASGFDEDQDPYFVHYFRVGLDGNNLIRLTEGNGTHEVSFSPDRRFIVDTYSRVDMAPISELRSGVDGKLIKTLETGSLDALIESGWRAPEPFIANGRDGKTKIHGVIIRPSSMRRRESYPVLENIYAGPHSAFVPKSFRPFYGMQAMAEMGFVVVQIDGMGTNHRSKAFHDVCWKNVGDAGLPDRKLWLRAAAKRYRFMDLDRVGIYGTSAGGQSAMGALLFHGDFYHVAVASCGCHDNRVDKASWNEQWMGYPVGPHYAEQSNVTNAHKLQGKLLLIVGELDTNVPTESTYQVVDALIRADKDFEFLPLPRAGHTSGGRYGERRRRDFFMEHLLDH